MTLSKSNSCYTHSSFRHSANGQHLDQSFAEHLKTPESEQLAWCWAPEAQLAHKKSKCATLAEELGYPLQSILDEVADRRCNLMRIVQRMPSGPMPAAHELGYREQSCWYDLRSGNHSTNKRRKCKGPQLFVPPAEIACTIANVP